MAEDYPKRIIIKKPKLFKKPETTIKPKHNRRHEAARAAKQKIKGDAVTERKSSKPISKPLRISTA